MIQQDLILKPNYLKIGWRLLNSQFLVSWTFILYYKVKSNEWEKPKGNLIIIWIIENRFFFKSRENFFNV